VTGGMKRRGEGEEGLEGGWRDGMEKRGIEKKENEGYIKVAFWNVAGLGNKDKQFWKGLEEWDVMVLVETWVEERGWGKIREKLPK